MLVSSRTAYSTERVLDQIVRPCVKTRKVKIQLGRNLKNEEEPGADQLSLIPI